MAAGGGLEGLKEMEEDASIRGGRERGDPQRRYRGGVAHTGSSFLSHNHPKHVFRVSVFFCFVLFCFPIKWGLVEISMERIK